MNGKPEPNSLQKISTGIAGLDEILGGGLPHNHMYLVQGESGTGKTTLGLQFVLAGAETGEEVLFISLSETAQDLHQIAAAHGWSLEGVHIYEPLDDSDIKQLSEEQTVFHSAEVELGEITDEILKKINQIRPKRLVFDSITELRLMAEAPLRYRRHLVTLRQILTQAECTALLLSNEPSEWEGYEALRSLAHGTILLERRAPDYGQVRRRLQVAQMRGMTYHTGYHDFKIVPGGLEVYPRLKIEQPQRQAGWAVMSSGIAKLDTMLGGGLEAGSACLIAGQSGTGKTSLVTQYVHTAAAQGQGSAVFLFDEHLETFYKRAEGLGLELRSQVEAGQLEVRQINSGAVAPGEFMQLVREAVEKEKIKIVAIDSLGGFLSAMPQERLLVTQLRELLLYLGEQEVLTLLVMTQHGLPGHQSETPLDLSYMVDTVLLLRHFESEGVIRKAISVLKKRSGFHEKTIREVQVTDEGIQLSDPLIDFSGVLTGFPTYKGPEERLLDEEEKPDDNGT